MSKSPDGRPFGPKITFAGIGRALILIPIDCISCATIACEVVRGALPDVQDQLKVAGRPAHCQIDVLLALGELGPPVQCFFSSAIAFAGL